jgi:hypothetical protein
MKPAGRLLPLLCVLVAALVLPAGSQANFVVSSSRSAEAHLAGTHGYRLTISADNETVFVTATNGDASVDYFLARAKLAGDLIDARLPGVGRVFLRFHEQERGRQPGPKYCHGPAPVVRRGVFVGWVRIRGEHDYTQAESRHVRGKIVNSFRSSCHLPFRARAGSGALEHLDAVALRGKGLLIFSAISFPIVEKGSPLFFRAALSRQRGSMLVANSVSAITKKAESLSIATPPRSATVEPPSPFTGSATFQRESKTDFSWAGNLAAELPGIGEVPLAGPNFESALCIGRRCRGDLNEGESGTTSIAIVAPRAAAPTPSPWRWPGSPR